MSNDAPRPSIALFGKDHWSTFAFLEICAVENQGRINIQRMRCDPELHPGLAHEGSRFGKPSPTRLKHGATLHAHDDWSCFEDLEAAGLVKWIGTGIHPCIQLTKKGQAVAARLRAFKQGGGNFADFTTAVSTPH